MGLVAQGQCGTEANGATDAGARSPIMSDVARLLIRKLSERCERYCILAGYERLPDSFETDIDFMVSHADFARIPALVDEIAAETGSRLFQVIPHEVSARAFLLACETGREFALVQLDSCSDYRHFGKLWLKCDEVLETTRANSRGFRIPEPKYEFIYYLIKRINKRDFREAHGERLSRLYREDGSGCNALLRRFWKARSADALTEMAAAENWAPLMHDLSCFLDELRRGSGESFSSKMVSWFKNALHGCERIAHPTGGWIAFIGPDGCGKSSVIDAVAREMAPAFQEIVRYHLRPKTLPARMESNIPVTTPHAQPVRGSLLSITKLIYFIADYWLGYFLQIRNQTVRTRLVLFDRYFYDIVVDPRRVLYGGPSWLLKALARLVPKPDLILLLNASPNVLWSRKQEVAYDEVERQQREFLQVARGIANAIVIDAAQPAEVVARQSRKAIVAYFSSRTHHRLGLPGRANSGADLTRDGHDQAEPSKSAEPGLALGSIFSGASVGCATNRLPVRIIARNGAPKWILPENARSAVAVLNSWRPYGTLSRLKWGAITGACRLNSIALLPGVASEILQCDLSYWRERISGFSESWSIVGYIGTPTPTRKALLFFVGPDRKVQAVVKVPLCPGSGSAILNEANILDGLQSVLPTPRVLFRDEVRGIAAQSWIGGANVARRFTAELLALLTSFASQDGSVRLSDFREEIAKRVALAGPAVDAALLRDALSRIDRHEEVRSCIEHGDFAPWNLRRLSDGQLTLIDWEWGRENGLPWLDVCRYFYLQDYLFRESADVWQILSKHPLLIEYRRYYSLSGEISRALTIYSLLNILCEEPGNQSRVEYAAQKIREAMARPF